MLEVEVGKQLDVWLGQSDSLHKWEGSALTASERRVLIMQWVGGAMESVDNRLEYRFRLFEKCGMVMTVAGSGDGRITLESLGKPYSFMEADDSSDDDGDSQAGGSGGEEDGRSVGGGEMDVITGGQDDGTMDTGDTSDEDDGGKF